MTKRIVLIQLCEKDRKDCSWSSWKPWSDCSVSCGLGERRRQRTKYQEAQDGGIDCVGKDAETMKCHHGPCEG